MQTRYLCIGYSQGRTIAFDYEAQAFERFKLLRGKLALNNDEPRSFFRVSVDCK